MQSKLNLSLSRCLLIAAVLSFVLGCFCQSIVFSRVGEISRWAGWEALCMGELGVFIGQFGWLANPLAVLAMILLLLKRPGFSLVFAISAFLVSLDAFCLFTQEIPANEGMVGPPLRVIRFGAGFYFWIASIVLVVIASISAFSSSKKQGLLNKPTLAQ